MYIKIHKLSVPNFIDVQVLTFFKKLAMELKVTAFISFFCFPLQKRNSYQSLAL